MKRRGAISKSKASFHGHQRDVKQRDILRSNDFFDVTYRPKKYFYRHLIDIFDEPARPNPIPPDPDATLFDGLFLKYLKRSKLEEPSRRIKF